MLNEKIIQVLSYDLDPSRIKTREKGSVSLSYLEGFDIIDTANKIFGYGHWSYSVSTLEHVSQETNEKQNLVVGYKAIVSLTVYDHLHTKHVSREDVGFGTGIAKSLADAHEGGAKEAVTDALKRCFRSFGNQFGNSLYGGKSRSYGNQPPAQLEPPKQHSSQPPKQLQNATPQDYASLYNIGLSVVTQGEYLIVTGDDLFSKKDSIKSFGFRWDGKSKQWYKPIEQQAA
ncbi:MAG: RAD52 family DNA repair protein [Sulfuricurvum sp.]|uniref:Rad52/Rad22 family DNA repair protein n=1 Tax=Sulfuricurvum sp. TaxID=2025608 RepID=UPI0025ED5B81|nr:Rad52/Rad22 family DNA repair protein [Sulfuricurvum sp.]MBV5322183.1 RAD52 family DNA repair protein [Sulfuricurvum sp.]